MKSQYLLRSILSLLPFLFTLSSSTAEAQGSVDSLVLINAESNQDLGPVANGAAINLAAVGTSSINFRAEVTGNVKSVVFAYDANSNFRTESVAPYAFAGDSSGNYLPFTPDLGQHTIVATPYSQSGGAGVAGQALTVTFTITNSSLILNPISHNFGSVPLGNSGTVSFNLQNNSPASSGGAILEQNGLAVFEVESKTNVPFWASKTSISGFTGSAYYEWDGPDSFGVGGNGTITYPIQISTPGNYELRWRSYIALGDDATEHNDSWVQFPTGQDVSGEQPLQNKWTKVYMSQKNRWSWQSRTVDNVGRPLRQFFSAGLHEVKISGRSRGHAIDRIVLYKYNSVPFSETTFTNLPPSPTSGGSGQAFNISEIEIAGANPSDFSYSGPNIPFALTSGQSAQFSVDFEPQSLGQRSATLSVESNAPSSPEVALLEGVGESASPGELLVTPAAHDFGTTTVGQTALQALSVVLENTGSSQVTVNTLEFQGSNPGNFQANKSAPLTIASGDSQTVNVSFTPSAVGPRSADLVFSTTAGTKIVNLVGTGETAAPGNQVISFTLVNADTDQDISGITSGATISASNSLNIRANTSPTVVGSVKFELSGDATLVKTESVAPYAFFGDISGNYSAGSLSAGNYTLKATPYSLGAAKGIAGTALTVNFTVSDGAVGSLEVTPATHTFPDTEIGQLSSSRLEVSINNTGTIAVSVSALEISGTNSGDFSVDPSNSFSLAPSDSASVFIDFLPTASGQRSGLLKVFSDTPASPQQITFSGLGTTPPSGLSVVSLILVDAATDQELGELENGDVVNLADFPDLNVVAVTNPAIVGSVRFGLNSQAEFATENVAPYALFGDIAGNYNSGAFSPQVYTITATPYELSGAKGNVGTALTVQIEVINLP